MLIRIFILFFVLFFQLNSENIDDSMNLNQYRIDEIQSELNTKIDSSNETNVKMIQTLKENTNVLWIVVASILVFFMQAGFALVEAGFTREKNTVNILMKNLSDFIIGSIAFFIIGFSLMFGPQLIDGIGFGIPSNIEMTLLSENGKPSGFKYAFFFFQLVFAGTAATIVSGAMAERMKFPAYLIFTVFMTSIIYPIFGSLVWGSAFGVSGSKGYLEGLGFIDFAGSTVVHSIGGWTGFAGAIILGPRLGRYEKGNVAPIMGHNMTIATLGVFILWLGWFGFNPGSTLSIENNQFAIIAVVTNSAAAAGALGAMITSWIIFSKPDIGITLNGILAGLVSITAGCNNVSITSALIIGGISGIIVIFGIILLDKVKIDDPVGAIIVHGLSGAWGTFAVGLFADSRFGSGVSGVFFGGGFHQLLIQMIGIAMAFTWAFGFGLILFFILKKTIGLRVSEDEEIIGLDLLEHGNEAYPESK